MMISERLLDVTQDCEGEYIHVTGQFRSYNRHEEKKNRLVLSVFAREVEFVEDDDESMKTNSIFLDGYICKPPVYRKTAPGEGDRRSAGSGEPSLWQIGLYSLYLLGKKRPVCLRVSGGRTRSDLGENSEQGIRQKDQRRRDRKKDRI